jgi:hypothetical protein
MMPYLNQVNEICNSVDYLELITDELDQFSYYLGNIKLNLTTNY